MKLLITLCLGLVVAFICAFASEDLNEQHRVVTLKGNIFAPASIDITRWSSCGDLFFLRRGRHL